MKKIVFLILPFFSCENKYKINAVDNEDVEDKQGQTITIDGEKYKITGEINLNSQNEK